MKKKALKISPFAALVYAAAQRVPRGRVATYSALAKAIGLPGASRAIGNALHRNPFAPKVPCHRIVRSDGSLGGFASGPAKKARLLRQEGIEIKHDSVDLQKYGYGF